MRLIFFHSGDLKSHIMIKFAPAQEEVRTMKIKEKRNLLTERQQSHAIQLQHDEIEALKRKVA